MKVNVKWGKELFSDIDVDTTQPPMVLKSQLFTLSGVPPERQKVLIKGGQLKDDEWGKQQPKEGMTIMMIGSADEIKVEAPTNAPKFVEDLPGVLLLRLSCTLLLFLSLPFLADAQKSAFDHRKQMQSDEALISADCTVQYSCSALHQYQHALQVRAVRCSSVCYPY
jgi:hypothetical protein